MNVAYGMIAGVIDAATSPLGVVGLALQSPNFTPTDADAQNMYVALQPFQSLFGQYGGRPVRFLPAQPMPWSVGSMPPATPNDISSLLGRILGMFPNGLPSTPAAPPPAQALDDNAPAPFPGIPQGIQGGQVQGGQVSQDQLGSLSGLFDSAQQLLSSGNPADQLQGQQQLQNYQSLVQLFSTLLALQDSMRKMIFGNINV